MKYNKIQYLKYILFFISIFLFALSLFQPAFFIDREDSDALSDSLFLFALGWMSFLGGGLIPFIIWLANPLYLLSLFLVKKNIKTGKITISISIILALIFANLNEILTSESGSTSKITELGNGFFLWISSFVILFFCSLFQDKNSSHKSLLNPALKTLINERTKDPKIFKGTTVNERLHLSGLTEIFEHYKTRDQETTKYILKRLKIDEESIKKIL